MTISSVRFRPVRVTMNPLAMRILTLLLSTVVGGSRSVLLLSIQLAPRERTEMLALTGPIRTMGVTDHWAASARGTQLPERSISAPLATLWKTRNFPLFHT